VKERGKTCPKGGRVTSAATRANNTENNATNGAINGIVGKHSKRHCWRG